jgi:hypothetical protein
MFTSLGGIRLKRLKILVALNNTTIMYATFVLVDYISRR